ncbi:aminotransferase [Pseudomassariella vexata]|uniref:Aminotransferase n=1 Tax=Pseudomassariella vexata TaxID=1141098 RepID=A0A1Y2E3R4_9PEZI|nr:aminotransferase [Pseudomassariella vexata]ORY66087.1 aminotransferase [Pseudomassariella vexata]
MPSPVANTTAPRARFYAFGGSFGGLDFEPTYNFPTTNIISPFPPPPVNTIDWSNVGFRVREVALHYSVHTKKWTPPQFVADPYIRIHGMAPALNYGQQAYEGRKPSARPEYISCPPVPVEHFVNAVKATVSLNAEYVPPHETGAARYIRPQIYGSSGQLGLSPPEEYMFCVYVLPTGVYHGTHPVDALILDDFDRAAPNGTGSAKVGGNYAPVLRWSDKARTEGYGITLHLNSATHSEVDEFSTSGFIGALVDGDNVTLVVPDSKNVIKSVTADSITDIGKSFGWNLERRSIKYTELPNFSEVMAAGTTAALVPIRTISRCIDPSSPDSISAAVKQHPRLSSDKQAEKVNYIEESQEDAGPVCLKLLTQLKAIQLGKAKDEFGWCAPVTAEDGAKITGVPKATKGDGQTVDQLD